MSAFKKTAFLRSSSLSVTLAFGAASVIFITPNASAQDYTSGSVEGIVTQGAGTPVSGVSAILQSTDRGFTREDITDNSGAYRFTRLPVGDYTVRIEGEPERVLSISAGDAARRDFVTGAIDEIITTGQIQSGFDFEAATRGLTVDVDELLSVIPAARSLEAVTLLAPGTAQGDTAFNSRSYGNLVSLGGASVAENVYYLNGMNLTNFRNFLGGASVPFEFYDEIQTKTGALPAEFGRATGGVINAVTRSGSNEFHFGASLYHEDESLRESEANTTNTDGTVIDANVSEMRESTEYNFWASGALIKDRIFAYGLYSPRKTVQTVNSAEDGSTVEYTSDDPFYGGKLDIVLADNHLLELTGFRNDNTERSSERSATFNPVGQLDDIDPADTAREGISETGGDVYIAKYTGNLTDDFSVSLMYGEQTSELTTQSIQDVFPIIRDRRSGGLVDVDQAVNNFVDSGSDKRTLLRADADYYVDDVLGRHHVRFGFDQETLNSVASRDFSGGIYYTYYGAADCDALRDVASGEDCLRVLNYKLGGRYETEQTAFYIQDSWDVTDALTLNVGLRNESFSNSNGNGETFIEIDNQWAPRLSFAYAPEFDDSGTLFGGFSRYYMPVASNTNITRAGSNIYTDTWFEFDSINADFTPVFDDTQTPLFGATYADGIIPSPESLVDANVEPHSVDEFIAGYTTDLNGKFDGELSHWNVGAVLTHTKLNNIFEDISIDNGVQAYCLREGLTCTANTQAVITNPGNDISIVVNNLPGGAERVTLLAEDLGYPKAKRDYTGLELTFDRVVEGSPLQLHGSWTMSRLKGNYEGSVKSDNGQADPGITEDFDYPELTENASGFLPNHRAHNFKLYGNYKMTEALNIGANIRVVSPRKFGCIGAHPTWTQAGLNQNTWYCEGEATPRGSQLESDWTSTLDLNLGYRVPLVTKGTLLARADIFNLLDSRSVTDLYENGDAAVGATDSYGQAAAYQTPRYMRLGLEYRY